MFLFFYRANFFKSVVFKMLKMFNFCKAWRIWLSLRTTESLTEALVQWPLVNPKFGLWDEPMFDTCVRIHSQHYREVTLHPTSTAVARSDSVLALVQPLMPSAASNSCSDRLRQTRQQISGLSRWEGDANLNHAGALMWVRQVLQRPMVGGRMPTGPTIHTQSADAEPDRSWLPHIHEPD